MFNQEFIDKDFRVNRPAKFSIPSTTELTVNRHKILLPKDIVQGKRILDIGSFIGQTGDWCLNLGASSYTGVEINPEFCATSVELLNKYHPTKSWKIIEQSLEDFFTDNVDHFDIIFCWGVLHSIVDHVWLLKQMAKCGNHIILNGRHPKVMWKGNQDIIPPDFWHELEYNIPYQEWHDGGMTVLYGNNASLRVTASNTSLGAVKLILDLEGFTANTDIYKVFKQLHPTDFGMHRNTDQIGYFVAEFYKNNMGTERLLLNRVFKEREHGLTVNPIFWDQA
jgi:SAM-dependent methyltransferase